MWQDCVERTKVSKTTPKIHDVFIRHLLAAACCDGSMLHLEQFFVASFRYRLWPKTDALGSQRRLATVELLDGEISLSLHQEFGTTAPQLCQFGKDQRIIVVAIWKLLFYSKQYHPHLWLGDLQWTMLQCLGAEVNGTAALLEMLIDEVPKKPQQELSLILFPNKSWRTIT